MSREAARLARSTPGAARGGPGQHELGRLVQILGHSTEPAATTRSLQRRISWGGRKCAPRAQSPPCPGEVRRGIVERYRFELIPSQPEDEVIPAMDTHAKSGTATVARRADDRSEMHNASVDEELARAGECAQVHLPTGRTCTLPHGHKGSCEFISADSACASLAHHGKGQ